jgi:hypothetical protein
MKTSLPSPELADLRRLDALALDVAAERFAERCERSDLARARVVAQSRASRVLRKGATLLVVLGGAE